MAMPAKRPWRYLSRDMDWEGAVVGLVILGLILADLAILGTTIGAYIGIAVIAIAGGTVLRLTPRRPGQD